MFSQRWTCRLLITPYAQTGTYPPTSPRRLSPISCYGSFQATRFLTCLWMANGNSNVFLRQANDLNISLRELIKTKKRFGEHRVERRQGSNLGISECEAGVQTTGPRRSIHKHALSVELSLKIIICYRFISVWVTQFWNTRYKQHLSTTPELVSPVDQVVCPDRKIPLSRSQSMGGSLIQHPPPPCPNHTNL
jgi:hypothetical protein